MSNSSNKWRRRRRRQKRLGDGGGGGGDLSRDRASAEAKRGVVKEVRAVRGGSREEHGEGGETCTSTPIPVERGNSNRTLQQQKEGVFPGRSVSTQHSCAAISNDLAC